MYNNCLHGNPADRLNNNNNNNMNSTARTSITNGLSASDPSVVNADLSLLEAAFKEATPSNRSLSSSTTFASNQLIAAANAARSAHQQQHSLSIRTTTNSDSHKRVYHSAGANSKANVPFSTFPSSTSTVSYPNLLQDVARSNPIFQLLQEAAKQQSCTTCQTDKSKTNTNSQFLTPKSFDITTSQVSFSLFIKNTLVLLSSSLGIGWK